MSATTQVGAGLPRHDAGGVKPPLRGKIRPQTLKALHAEWRKLSPSLEGEGTEREARLEWTNSKLVTRHLSPVTSWSDLTEGEAKRLVKIMREESGSQAEYLAHRIADLAITLTGDTVACWEFLHARCQERFRVGNPMKLAASQAHALIEELMRRVAEREGVTMEEVRARFAPPRAQGKAEL